MTRSQTPPLLEIRDLHVSADNGAILRGVDLSVGRGEVHALMGPNGAGKSTLAGALMGQPGYAVTAGTFLLNGEDVTEWMERLGMDTSFASRHLNQGFSGGEKKRNEILQMALLKPIVAVLDETDSGLDIDALRVVGRGVRAVREELPELGVLAITHYERLLEELVPDVVHVLVEGRIVESGGAELARTVAAKGYEAWR